VLAAAVQAAKVPVEWEHHTISTHAVTPGGDLISQEALDSVIRNKVGLKGKDVLLHTPVTVMMSICICRLQDRSLPPSARATARST
jgi:hypothetical protein